MSSQNEFTTDQHIIPASYIGLFSAEQKWELRKSEVFYWDINWHINTKHAGKKPAACILKEDWYFEMQNPNSEDFEHTNMIEKQLWTLENKFTEIIRWHEFLWNLNGEDTNILFHYMVHLYMRTSWKREEIEEEITKKMNEAYPNTSHISLHKENLKKLWLEPDRFDKYNSPEGRKMLGKTLHAMSVVWYIDNPDNPNWNPLYKKTHDIFTSYKYHFVDTNGEFISWDQPVVRGSKCIIFPITWKKCIIWLLPWPWSTIPIGLDFINRAIASNAKCVIFWSSSNVVKYYKEFIGIWKRDLNVLKYLDI